MDVPIRIVGSYLSPYVRKVLVCLHLKNLPYEIDPIVPFYGNDDFGKVSPLRRIPVLIDEDATLCDSTVICEYLNDRYPDPPLLPGDATSRALARWYEEFADSRLGEVLIWHLYNQVVIRRFVWGEGPDESLLEKAHREEIPSVLDYLESLLPPAGFLFDTISIADIALAGFFRNAKFARYEIDQVQWPNASTYVSRVLAQEAFVALQRFELVCLRTPIQDHRAALLEAGAPISRETFGSSAPRRGVLAV